MPNTIRLTTRETLMLINMILFLILGTVIVIRSLSQNGPWTAYLFGIGCLIAGGYRLYLVYKTVVVRGK